MCILDVNKIIACYWLCRHEQIRVSIFRDMKLIVLFVHAFFWHVNKKIERNELIMFKKLFGQMQRIGKALMLPVAILPAAGLLLAIGTAFQGEALQHYLPFIKNDIVQQIANMLTGAGGIIFDNLPIIFALGVAIGLAGGDGVAAIAAFVGFIILNKTMGLSCM